MLEGPWSLTCSEGNQIPTLRSLNPNGANASALLAQGQWTHTGADVQHLELRAPGLPFMVHEAHCTQPRQKCPGAWRRANDANQAASMALIGIQGCLNFCLARKSSLALRQKPMHVPRWRKAFVVSFALRLHMMRVLGHLESPMGVACFTHLPPGFRTSDLGDAHPSMPDVASYGEASSSEDHFSSWLQGVRMKSLLSLLGGLVLTISWSLSLSLSLTTHKTELIVRGVYGAGKEYIARDWRIDLKGTHWVQHDVIARGENVRDERLIDEEALRNCLTRASWCVLKAMRV